MVARGCKLQVAIVRSDGYFPVTIGIREFELCWTNSLRLFFSRVKLLIKAHTEKLFSFFFFRKPAQFAARVKMLSKNGLSLNDEN